MQVIRRARADERAWSYSHHVAGRQHAEGGFRCRHADSNLAIWCRTSDGQHAAYTDWTSGDIVVRDLRTGVVTKLTHNPKPWADGYGLLPKISRDGKWVAYSSDESGKWEVYVAPFSLGRAAGSLAIPHKDPFDRLLIAQAVLEGMTLVSNEAAFDAFGVSRLW